MRRIGSTLAAVLVLATACTASEVDPDARIDIGGTIRRQNGNPAGGLRVGLSREADVGEIFTVFATFGLACLDMHTCRGARVSRADADGRFTYELKGRDTQGFAGQASTMVLTSGLGPREIEATGPITTYRFQVQTEKLDVPLAFWETPLEGSTGSFGARVAWTPVPGRVLPPGLGHALREYAIEFRRGGETVWTVDRARSGFAFDARPLEDTVGTASVVGAIDGEKVPDELGRQIDVVLRSGARAYESPAGAPPSRGAACSILDANGRLVAQSPCVLTDGDFTEEFSPSEFSPSVCGGATGCTEPSLTSAVVDLGGRRPVSLIVVRGCTDRCTVETSRDAKAWRTAGVAASESAALRVSPAVNARYLRVSAPTSISRLTEVSAWSNSQRVAAGPLFIDPGAIETGRPGSSPQAGRAGSKDAGSDWLRLVAVGLLCGAGGALIAVSIGRRKRRVTASRS